MYLHKRGVYGASACIVIRVHSDSGTFWLILHRLETSIFFKS